MQPASDPTGLHFDSESTKRLALSKLGLGCVTFGREIAEKDAFAMMDYAIVHGVSFFDTAAAYSLGRSESIVGAWLAANPGEREHLTLATKLLPPYSKENVERRISESLARLNLESVDLLFLHQWHDSALLPEVLQSLDGMVRSGRVRALGASNFTAGQLGQLLDLQASLGCATIAALQNAHNFALRGFDASLRALCSHADIALVGYSPLGAGFLTGKYRAGVDPESRFGVVPGHQAIYFTATSQARLARLESIATRAGLSVTKLALAWALHDPLIATVLIGGRNVDQIEQARVAQAFDEPALFAELNDPKHL